jgi:hypothetical protein
MKHESCKALYRYWDSLREPGNIAPERSSIEPSAISDHLRDTFILEATGSPYPFRLAGTRLCAILGSELRGTSFLTLWSAADRDQVETLLEGISEEGIGAVLGVAARGPRDDDIAMELLLLPVIQSAPAFDRVLGALIPIQLPYWLGLKPIQALEVTSARQLRPGDNAAGVRLFSPKPSPAMPPGIPQRSNRRGDRFVLLQGGKS